MRGVVGVCLWFRHGHATTFPSFNIHTTLALQENLMREYHDNHDAPNIDVQYVAIRGWAVKLPEGVQPL